LPDINLRLVELGIELPPLPEPAANYVPAVVSERLVYLSGQTPKNGSTIRFAGKIGEALSIDDGYAAAELCTLRLLSVLQSVSGDLNNVEKILKLTAFVNAVDGFEAHPQVVNGASDLLVKLFGERGRHARSAVGVSSLPSGAAVEIEMIAQLHRHSP
jgi:enamine deaminase RidA (YjgF/YER057c/UK114 family)